MQTIKKRNILPNYSEDERLQLYQQTKNDLQQILATLIRDKEECEKQQKTKTQVLSVEIKEKQSTIEYLTSQNQQLKAQLQTLRTQLSQKISDLSSLRRENQVLERRNVSNKNIITYLQAKNKEINYELYEAKKIISLKKKQDHSSKELKVKSSNHNPHQPEYIFNRIDYPSIFDYTGVIDQDVSLEMMQRNQCNANLEAITTTSSDNPKMCRNYSSDMLKQLNQTDQKQHFIKLKTQLDECDLPSQKDTRQLKGSLKKINTLGHLLNSGLKRDQKESRRIKRKSIDKDLQSWQKQKMETKSRVGSKKAENTKKFK